MEASRGLLTFSPIESEVQESWAPSRAKSKGSQSERTLHESSTFYSLIKHISSLHPGLNVQLSKLKSIVDTKLMKAKHTEEKLVAQIEKQRDSIESLQVEVNKLRTDLQRKKDFESEVIYLRQKTGDLAGQLEEVQSQFSHALEVIEELQRTTHIKSNNLEMQHHRERQIAELAGNIEIQKLRVQFSAIVRQFKGEAGSYTVRDVTSNKVSDLVDENIKLRQRYHESQAQQVVLEQKLTVLQSKIEEYEAVLGSSSTRFRNFSDKRSEALDNVRADAQVGRSMERIFSSPSSTPLNSFGFLKKVKLPLDAESPTERMSGDRTRVSDSNETIFSKRRKDERQKSVEMLTDDLLSSLDRHNSLVSMRPQTSNGNFLCATEYASPRGHQNSGILGVTNLNFDMRIGLDSRKAQPTPGNSQAMTTRVKMSTSPLNFGSSQQVSGVGPKQIVKPIPSALKKSLLLGLKKHTE